MMPGWLPQERHINKRQQLQMERDNLCIVLLYFTSYYAK